MAISILYLISHWKPSEKLNFLLFAFILEVQIPIRSLIQLWLWAPVVILQN